MAINKFTTLLDLARQAKIISGETATFDGKIEAGIPFSGYPTGVDTGTTVSLGVVSSETAVFSGNTGTTVFDVSNTGSTNYDVIFSGYSTTTWTNPLFSVNTSGLTLPITPLSADTQIVGPFWTLTQTGMTGDYVIGTQYTGYSITYSFFGFDEPPTTAYTSYSGFTTASQENFSAGTLDYKGPLDYISSVEDATIDGRLTTNKLTVTGGASSATTGYVLTQTGDTGEVGWVFSSSSGTTDTNFAIGDLIFTGDRLHDTKGYNLNITDTTSEFQILLTDNLVNLTGVSSTLTRMSVENPTDGGISIGHRGSTEGSYPGYGKQGDGFVYSSINQNGLNIISQPGLGTDDYIRFFVGQAAGADGTSDLYIQGSGTTRGNVGINTDEPTEKLHVEGSVRIVDGSQNLGYVLTSDADGVGEWQVSSGGPTIDPYEDLGTLRGIVGWDVSGTSTNYQVIISGSSTLNLTNVRNGDVGTIIITQDGVGGHTLSFGTINGAVNTHLVVNGGGGVPSLTGANNATDILSFTYNGTIMYWTVGNNYT